MSATRNILVLTYWRYSDALVQAYTLPYLEIIAEILPPGSQIILVTMEDEVGDKPLRQVGPSIMNYRLKLHPFGARAMSGSVGNIMRLRRLIKSHNVDTIHCWCTPAGAIGYLLSRLTGKPLVIDSYEPHAEAMVENGTWKRSGLAYRLLFYLEKKMSHRAKALIACSPNMEAYAASRYGLYNRKIPVKPACTNLDVFHPSLRKNKALLEASGLEGKIVCVYAGKLGGIYLDQEVFLFFAACVATFGDKFRALLLTNTSSETINTYCRKAGLDPEVVITRFVPHAEVAAWIGLGDFAFTPVKPVPTKKCCTPIKDGEYWALGLPVVITPDISGDSELIAANRCGVILDTIPGTGYATAVAGMEQLLSEDRNELTARCRNLAEVYRNFNIAKEIYRQIYV